MELQRRQTQKITQRNEWIISIREIEKNAHINHQKLSILNMEGKTFCYWFSTPKKNKNVVSDIEWLWGCW